ncbi:Deoxyuridine 5'-triphosphate nucleotidohydrolase [subsurface metagenome]
MNRITVACTVNPELLPQYESAGAAGADLRADVEETITLNPGERRLIPTGLKVQLPAGFEAQVRSRSGLAQSFGVTVLNSPGTVDSDYRGEIKVLLINLGQEPFVINRADRIAQLIISKVARADFIPQPAIETTHRGEGGFGSTGK